MLSRIIFTIMGVGLLAVFGVASAFFFEYRAYQRDFAGSAAPVLSPLEYVKRRVEAHKDPSVSAPLAVANRSGEALVNGATIGGADETAQGNASIEQSVAGVQSPVPQPPGPQSPVQSSQQAGEAQDQAQSQASAQDNAAAAPAASDAPADAPVEVAVEAESKSFAQRLRELLGKSGDTEDAKAEAPRKLVCQTVQGFKRCVGVE